MKLSKAQKKFVYERAQACCEYCRIKETKDNTPFHVDHVVPIKHHGSNEFENLCLACYQCNIFKGSNYAAADPDTRLATFLFNPRSQIWVEHFYVKTDASLTGISLAGRVTLDVLKMNDEWRVIYRQL